jgi:hypothetical protein
MVLMPRPRSRLESLRDRNSRRDLTPVDGDDESAVPHLS